MAVLWRQRWRHSAIWRQQPIIGKSQVWIILDQRWEGGRRFSGEWDPGRKQGHCQSRKGPTPSRKFGPIGKRGSHLCLQDLKSQEGYQNDWFPSFVFGWFILFTEPGDRVMSYEPCFFATLIVYLNHRILLSMISK